MCLFCPRPLIATADPAADAAAGLAHGATVHTAATATADAAAHSPWSARRAFLLAAAGAASAPALAQVDVG
ncbi:MAG: hypothetical protein KA932_08400, partial [Giesbergeria sp.]|nr:hypothetical protein [Giesbergeria sp.]